MQALAFLLSIGVCGGWFAYAYLRRVNLAAAVVVYVALAAVGGIVTAGAS